MKSTRRLEPTGSQSPGDLRDETASARDRAAQQRDERAERRDREADSADQTVLELEGSASVVDARDLRVQELCGRGLEARNRAAGDREYAQRDRSLAAADREVGERDREQCERDRAYAAIDELTGARRRDVGLADLQREIERAHRTGGSLVVAFVDVDGLKAVNDKHGHQAGDELLQDVAEGLRRDMRPYDLLVRLGGDEFLCVLPGVTADQVRHRFEHLGCELPAGPTARSVSIGLGELRDGDGTQELVARADRDLLAGRAPRRSLA